MLGSKWRGSSGEPFENLPGIPGPKDWVWVSLGPYPQPGGLETPRWKHGSVVLCGEPWEPLPLTQIPQGALQQQGDCLPVASWGLAVNSPGRNTQHKGTPGTLPFMSSQEQANWL